VGNYGAPNQVYLNQMDGTLAPTWNSETGPTSSLAWGDIDGDGDLELTVGEYGPDQEIRIYENKRGQLDNKATYTLPVAFVYSLAFGDMDADGDLDLAAGIDGDSNKVYINANGRLQPTPGWLSNDDDNKSVVAWGDVNGDGYPDLVAANGPSETKPQGQNSKVYLNQRGRLAQDAAWASGRAGFATGVAWGDANGDGRLDLAFGNATDAKSISPRPDVMLYLNQGLIESPLVPEQLVTIELNETSRALAPANFYAMPTINSSRIIPITYTLSNGTGAPLRFVRFFYSADGGGKWLPAVNADTPDTLTKTNTVTDLPIGTSVSQVQRTGVYTPYTATYVYNWDVPESGFFGQSDNVVFRIEAYPGLEPITDSVANSYQQAFVSAQTHPFRVRGTQIQVLGGTAPISGAMVYRLPATQTLGGLPLGDDTPFITDENGYLQGRGQINVGDRLLALAPVPLPSPTYTTYYSDTMHLYYTNVATVTEFGVETRISNTNSLSVTELGLLQLAVSPDHPLILFDLDVSLEWDASYDPSYRQQLEFDLKKASQYLYDFTDGQVALGKVTVHQNADDWAAAHVNVYATNRVRPWATQGGVVIT
jgi:hypothetical protein